jgi:hypothetical protein
MEPLYLMCQCPEKFVIHLHCIEFHSPTGGPILWTGEEACCDYA